MKGSKKIFLFCLFLFALVGCTENRKDIDEITVLMSDYETAMKSQDYETADKYWYNPDDNVFSYYLKKIQEDDEQYLLICEELYAERLQFDISNIEVNGSFATADIYVYSCDMVKFINDLPDLYDFEKIMEGDYDRIKDDFEKNLIYYYKSDGGRVSFEKVDDVWKIKSMG